MISPQELIDDLDASLAESGQPVRLIRQPQTTFAVDCIATMRGYNPTDVVAGSDITQQDQQFVLSPTPLLAAGWPGPAIPLRGGDPLVPRNGDRIVSNAVGMTIMAAMGVYVQGVLVRIEGRARGG